MLVSWDVSNEKAEDVERIGLLAFSSTPCRSGTKEVPEVIELHQHTSSQAAPIVVVGLKNLWLVCMSAWKTHINV